MDSKIKNMTFNKLNIIESILKALNDKECIHSTLIQEQAILPVLKNRDILSLVQTKTDKTAVYAI